MVACLAVSGAEDLLSRLIGMRLLWLLLRQGYSMGLILEARGSTLHQCLLTGDAEPVSFSCFTFLILKLRGKFALWVLFRWSPGRDELDFI